MSDPDAIATAMPQDRRSAPNLQRAPGAAAEFWRRLACEDAPAVLDFLDHLSHASRLSDRVDIDLAAGRLASALLGEVGGELEDDPKAGAAGYGGWLRLSIAAELHPPALVRLLTRARPLADRLTANPSVTLEEAGAAESMGRAMRRALFGCTIAPPTSWPRS